MEGKMTIETDVKDLRKRVATLENRVAYLEMIKKIVNYKVGGKVMTKVECDDRECKNNKEGFCTHPSIRLETIPYEGLFCHSSRY